MIEGGWGEHYYILSTFSSIDSEVVGGHMVVQALGWHDLPVGGAFIGSILIVQ